MRRVRSSEFRALAGPLIGPLAAWLIALTGWLPDGPRVHSIGLSSTSTAFMFFTIVAWSTWMVAYLYVCVRVARGFEIRRAGRVSMIASLWFTLWLPAVYVTHSLYGLATIETISSQSRWVFALTTCGLIAALIRYLRVRRTRRWV